MFHYLKLGLSVVLTFIGIKMVIMDIVHVPIGIALGVVATVLTVSVVASLRWAKGHGISIAEGKVGISASGEPKDESSDTPGR